MINFTVGPVQSYENVLVIGNEQVPYFRTPEFSKIMLENEELMLKFANAPKNSRAVFITGSGTASMEAVVVNIISKKDKVLVVNGGSFGQRFVDLLNIYNVNHTQIKLEYGKQLKYDDLKDYESKGYTSFLINIHETSTGVHYDLNLVSDFCKRNNITLIVDAISSFMADEVDMSSSGIDVMITGSQKALACPPGVSIILLSPMAIELIETQPQKCMYLDLKSALINGKRGQTPFTPAVGILLQINSRLKQIDANGGVQSEIAKIQELAQYFRNKVQGLPFKIASESLSNAVTPLYPVTASAYDIFTVLKDEYGIWICPNGGDLKEKLFRVGHIGNLGFEDYDVLIDAFNDMKKRNLI